MSFLFAGLKDNNNRDQEKMPANGIQEKGEDQMDEAMSSEFKSEKSYDGVSYKELYPETRDTEWNHSRGAAKYLPTRLYLQQVRETQRRIELLERRVKLREEAGEDASDIEEEIDSTKQLLKTITVDIADEISKVGDVGQEMVLFKRYIDLLTWDEIAESMDIRIKTILKFHGYGLYHMSKILLEDGLIEEDDDDAKGSSEV